MAKATGTSSTAMLDTRPASLISRSGACSVPLEMSSSRPVVVPWANAAIVNRTAIARTPMSSRIRSEGRCTRAGSSGSSPETRSECAASAEASVEPARCPVPDTVGPSGRSGPCPAPDTTAHGGTGVRGGRRGHRGSGSGGRCGGHREVGAHGGLGSTLRALPGIGGVRRLRWLHALLLRRLWFVSVFWYHRSPLA
ncbi:hypothetical protein SCALM49S_01296 [Streptomyces californicus]